jgi:hypothetical protein
MRAFSRASLRTLGHRPAAAVSLPVSLDEVSTAGDDR